MRYTEPVRPRNLLHVEDLPPLSLAGPAVRPQASRAASDRGRPPGVRRRDRLAGHQPHASRLAPLRRRRHADSAVRAPGEVANRRRALVQELGLRYGAIDLILTPDDRFVFLEINPNGQYLWIELATDLPISAAIADHLLEG